MRGGGEKERGRIFTNLNLDGINVGQ